MEVNVVTTYALIDVGVQISPIVYSFVRQLQLEVHALNDTIWVEGTGGSTVPYLGYIAVHLQIPQFPQYEETLLMLVIPDSQYTYGIPIQIGTQVIQKVM